MLKYKNTIILMLILVMSATVVCGQDKKAGKPKRSLKDTLDGKLDFSSFLADAHGFIPIPVIITEQALGGFGFGLVPLFVTPKKSTGTGYTPPDLTAVAAMYTVNKTWVVGAFRSGSFPRAGLKYRVSLGYGSVNMAFYRDLPLLGEQKFEFNFRSLPAFVSLSKRITASEIYLGAQYLYLPVKLKPNFAGGVPDFISDKELKSHTATLGFFAQWDRRNTIFTPDKGYYLNLLYGINDRWTGSDFTYQRLSFRGNYFVPFRKRWIGGFRAEYSHVFQDPPFYLLPGVDMRGVPSARYQGESVYLAETEQRFDINPRWSVLAFGGIAKPVEPEKSWSASPTVWNAGGGFRYLLARLFGLRTGMDVAFSNRNWGWYIVVGHNWNR